MQTQYSLDEIRDLRFSVSREFLSGSGMEIGAGVNPQRLPDGVFCQYFDKHDKEFVERFFGEGRHLLYEILPLDDVPVFFPKGADFLIAHNVLEHCENPIATLVEWISYVREGGVLVIGLPLPDRCLNDSRRVMTPLRHVLDDYLFDRTQEDFESCEHIYSFRLGWRDDKESLAKKEYLDFVQDEALRKRHDIHWHIGDYEFWSGVVEAAFYFSGKSHDMLATTKSPEALFVIRVGPPTEPAIPPSLRFELSAYSHRLEIAANKLAQLGTTSADVTALLQELQKRSNDAEILSCELNRILRSRSWKVTAPLRSLFALLRGT